VFINVFINRSIAVHPQFDIPKEEVKAILVFLQSKGKIKQ